MYIYIYTHVHCKVYQQFLITTVILLLHNKKIKKILHVTVGTFPWFGTGTSVKSGGVK